MRTGWTVPALLAATALAGCGRAERALNRMPVDSSAIVLGAGDLLISNPDSTMELALVGDKVIMRFGEKLRRDMRASLDTTKADTSAGLGGFLSRTVKRAVGSAVFRRMEAPLSDIDAVSLDGNRIVFHYRERHGAGFEGLNVNNRRALDTFTQADAQRFVDAVRARKSAEAAAPTPAPPAAPPAAPTPH